MATRTEVDLATGQTTQITLTPAEDAAAAAALAAEQAANALPAAVRKATDETERQTVKVDANVLTFLNMSPTELEAWVDTNIGGAATLAALRTSTATALKVLGKLAQQGARAKLRNGG